MLLYSYSVASTQSVPEVQKLKKGLKSCLCSKVLLLASFKMLKITS